MIHRPAVSRNIVSISPGELDDRERDFERQWISSCPVVIDFWAPWCVPCPTNASVLEKLGKDYTGRIDMGKINTDEEPGEINLPHSGEGKSLHLADEETDQNRYSILCWFDGE
jgi:thiol-disulfide isomerase/thioredoxin